MNYAPMIIALVIPILFIAWLLRPHIAGTPPILWGKFPPPKPNPPQGYS